VVTCPQCGAHTHFDPNVVASTCAFCTAPLSSVAAHAERLSRPQVVLPFRLDDAAARQAFQRWIDSRWFAPQALREAIRAPEGGRGVYLPALPRDRSWAFTPAVKPGAVVTAGEKLGTVPEGIFEHWIMVPFALQGRFQIRS
jgi:hypothetical protein